MSQYETMGSGSVTATMVNDVNTIDTFWHDRRQGDTGHFSLVG